MLCMLMALLALADLVSAIAPAYWVLLLAARWLAWSSAVSGRSGPAGRRLVRRIRSAGPPL